ncbi:MAG: DNA cytosine methyltransferase [Chloroflexota bacterium]
MSLTCADLFCGAGGFSEGFRQAGFRVVHAVDFWRAAVETHRVNHPDTTVEQADLLSYAPERVGHVDVLIGSPPCTEFSFAKRGGSGDIEAGLRLVYRFLRFVYELKPKWWIMENVPRTLEFLPEEVPLSKLGVRGKGTLSIPRRQILLASDYGVPQRRARLFSGDFPLPEATHAQRPGLLPESRSLGDVIGGLPAPERRPQLGEVITDPIYDFGVPAHELTDHFSTALRLTDDEVDEIRRTKTGHSWYGKMLFPDALDRPARTVVATQLRPNREAIIVATEDGYRRLTVREASSVQSFPITYQWWAKTESLRYKLVGNAVPPLVPFAIAKEILALAGEASPEQPHVITTGILPSPDIELTGQRRRSHSLLRKFRDHVRGSKHGSSRIDFDNQGKLASPNLLWMEGRRHPAHLVEWRALLYRGSGKRVRAESVSLRGALERLALTISDARSLDRARRLIADFQETLPPIVPDASTLQAAWSGKVAVGSTPYRILDAVAEIVGRRYTSTQTVVYIDSARSAKWTAPSTAALLVGVAYVCSLANSGTTWGAVNLPAIWQPNLRARPVRKLRSNSGADPSRLFEAALKRYGPKDDRERTRRAGVEQLTLTGA